MSNWQTHYKNNTVSIQEAAGLIRSGDRVWVGNTCNVPFQILDLLADSYEKLTDITILSHMFANPLKMLSDPKYRKTFRQISYFPNAQERRAHDLGLLEYATLPLGYVGDSIDNVYKTNVILVETCEPDEDGYINLGLWGEFFTSQVFKGANIERCIAVVNKYHTPAQGDPDIVRVPVERFEAFCRCDHPLLAIGEAEPEEIDTEIAANIMEYIKDGDIVQVGKGGLGRAIGFGLASKKDISIYTEIVSDWVVDLEQKGVLKKVLAGACFGDLPLYEYCAKSKLIEFDTITNLENIDRVGKLDNFISINACMMTDLTGQICSEGVGAWQYSAIGGQLDFVKGTNKIRNEGRRGVGFIALRSTHTDKDGSVSSNIVVELPPASSITTPRGEAMYIVTEYGVADLWGKTIKDRVKAMIGIAHPEFRQGLTERAIALKLAHPQDFEESV